jgi:hypothetical protein
MHDHNRTQTEMMRPEDQETRMVAIKQRLARERLRQRALKATRLARAAVWRRFLRQRLRSHA